MYEDEQRNESVATDAAVTNDEDRDSGGGPDRDPLDPWADREEVEALPEILAPDEAVVAVGSGTVLRTGRLAHSSWLVVLTEQRVLCIKGRAADNRKVIEMPVSAISGAQQKGLMRKTLVLSTSYGTLQISGLKGPAAAELVEALETLKQVGRE